MTPPPKWTPNNISENTFRTLCAEIVVTDIAHWWGISDDHCRFFIPQFWMDVLVRLIEEDPRLNAAHEGYFLWQLARCGEEEWGKIERVVRVSNPIDPIIVSNSYRPLAEALRAAGLVPGVDFDDNLLGKLKLATAPKRAK